MNQACRHIVQRMSLRKPQEKALETLINVTEKLDLIKNQSIEESLEIVKDLYPQIIDFERAFPNLCFALATGVGKTRLMGAMIAYLAQEKGIRNFFVLAPNNTILEKLEREFSQPSNPKYVFKGLGEFSTRSPRIITSNNFDDGLNIRNKWARSPDLFESNEIHINIFNVAMIHSQDRKIKSQRETIVNCMSYFEYLSQLDDLVVIMDEAHRYRAGGATNAINELRPVLGIELTATPQIEKGNQSILFKNIIYHYPLSAAMQDGLVKDPSVVGRENFDVRKYDEKSLERLKIEDGIRIHEDTKLFLQNYAYEQNKPAIKPFILIITQSIIHANEVEALIKQEDFFEGRYQNKIRVVHSGKKPEDEERMIKDLLEIESFENPIEIVIHVNMLKEGWDVKNLYTVIPLRSANSKTLIEQSLGRGLRLPFGKRTGVVEIDRLSIVSHDRFNEIIDEAKNPQSIIRSSVLLGRDIPLDGFKNVEVRPRIALDIDGMDQSEKDIAEQVLTQIEAVGSQDKQSLIDQLVSEAKAHGDLDHEQVRRVATKIVERHEQLSISIPRIHVEPELTSPGRYYPFTLDLKAVFPQSIEHNLLHQSLSTGERQIVACAPMVKLDENPSHYLAKALLDLDDVADNDDNVPVVLNLTDQMISHLQYLKDEKELQNVLHNHREGLVKLIHAQMQNHYVQPQFKMTHVVARDYTFIKSARYIIPSGQNPIPFDQFIDDQESVKSQLFCGFMRSVYPIVKFDSHSERIFASVLEEDSTVIKWVKPPRKTLSIFYHKDHVYEPDFVVETHTHKLLCEVKRHCDLTDPTVIEKANAATHWCALASQHAKTHAGKEWKYILIPHDEISITTTLSALTSRYMLQCVNAFQEDL